MRRREFIAGLGSAAAWPVVGRAQQPGRIRRMGVLMSNAEGDLAGPPRIKILQQALQELGWIDGHNIQINVRWGGSELSRISRFADELLAQAPDVILVSSSATLSAMRRRTTTVPIVFVNVTDPQGSGTGSLAKPVGNVTGFSNFQFSIGSKWLELLKDMVNSLAHVSVLFDPDLAPSGGWPFVKVIETAAQSLDLETHAAPVRDDTEVAAAMTALASQQGSAYIVLPDGFTTVHRVQIAGSAVQYRLPGIFPFPDYAADGALMTYGPKANELYRPAASYVDRILHGAEPGDLPIQFPTKLTLVVNLKTAKTLGLTFPPSILLRADEVIE